MGILVAGSGSRFRLRRGGSEQGVRVRVRVRVGLGLGLRGVAGCRLSVRWVKVYRRHIEDAIQEELIVKCDPIQLGSLLDHFTAAIAQGSEAIPLRVV
jgi:hypothetical protein